MKNDIGNRIRRERLMRNLKQEQVAEELGMSAGNYGKIERGDISVSISQLEKLAHVFGLTLADLVVENQKSSDKSLGYGYVSYSEFQALVHDFRQLVSDVDSLKSFVLPKKKTALKNKR